MVTTADALDTEVSSCCAGFPAGGDAWGAVVNAVLREAVDPRWDSTVPPLGAAPSLERPVLAGTTVCLPPDALARVNRRGWDASRAVGAGSEEAPAWRLDDQHMPRLFEASLDGDQIAMEAIAQQSGVDAAVVESFGYLLPVPFLHACQRHPTNLVMAAWAQGYCPICGSWPAFAEVLGVERTRQLRCGRCGAAWQAQPVSCSFCGTNDHRDLVTLVPRRHLASTADNQLSENVDLAIGGAAVEACTRCSRYVKRFATLDGCSPLRVMLQDLASVALDFAAIEEGYVRPQGTGYPLRVRLHRGDGDGA